MIAPVAMDIEWFWERLLQCIAEDSVIPVIGSDLLVLPIDGRQVPLYSYLAAALAAELRLPAEPLPASGPLHEVACRFKAQGGNIHFVYSKLKTVLSRAKPLQVPEPLRKLARIRSFKLFVSLTFDSLLEQAIDEERFGGEERTESLAYYPAGKDPKVELAMAGTPIVLHLFGKLSSANDYAVTEEDILEFVHALQSEDRLPELLSSLDRKSLLLLGSSFPDWLTRFFLRIGSGEQRLSASGRTDVIADSKVRQDPGLVSFLRSFSPETQVFEDPIAFVAELSARWDAAHTQPASSDAGYSPLPPAVPPGAIFLSYAHEDEEAAATLRDILAAEGMAVWFDKTALRGGDAWEEKIFRALRSCCLCVPVISRHTLTTEYRYFRREWDKALELLRGLPANRRFLFPVAVDDTPESAPEIPARFRDVQWLKLPDWKDPKSPAAGVLIDLLREEYRAYRLRQRDRE